MDTLRPGSRGAYTEMLQLALYRAGYLDEEPDGIFGPETERAVRSFQRASGISADGVAGPVTWRALRPFLTGYMRHTVRPRDTFYRLAAGYGSSVGAIAAANPAQDPLSLRIGSRLVIPLGFPVVPDNVSFTYELLSLCAEGLGARYPFLRVSSAGSSTAGKKLWLFSLGSGEGKVFYNAAHHANEWITSPLLMVFLETACRALAFGERLGNERAADIFSKCTLFLMPMVNPDGVDLVTGATSSGRFYSLARSIAADYPDIPFPSGWKANIAGTDLNLNYPANWELAKEIKYAAGFVSPAPRDYVGSAPLSAPESRAVYDLTRRNDFDLTLSYHTQGKTIYWKYLDFDPPRSLELAQAFSAASGYAVAETPYASGFAGYKDWFIQDYNRPGYTIEAGSGENPLPISQFGEIYADNFGILLTGLTYLF